MSVTTTVYTLWFNTVRGYILYTLNCVRVTYNYYNYQKTPSVF